MSEIPDITKEDVEWAYYLWNSLAVGQGRWALPNVGAYVRTGDKELTLREIHFSKPHHTEFGASVFDSHHWIMTLADSIGWSVKEEVLLATDTDGELNIPDELIGMVSICNFSCGAVFRVEELTPAQQYVKVQDDLVCPCCGEENGIDASLTGVHIVVDERGYILKKEREKANTEEE